MSIALKEANETEYWIDLLGATDYLKEEEFQSVKNDTHELLNYLLQYLSLQKEPAEDNHRSDFSVFVHN